MADDDQSISEAPAKASLGRRCVGWLIWLAVQLVLAFVLLEIVARIWDPMGISYFPETARHLDQVMIKEEPIGYRARPHYRGKHFGTTVSINSLGLRDREVPAEPGADEYRILVMGDSVPYGIGVEYEESIPHQLELIANQNSDGERDYRTINMGIPSYNTEQELVQLESLGLQLKPNLIVLMFATNDIEPKMWVFDKRSSLVANMAQRSYAASLLFVLKRNARQSTSGTDNRINWGAYEAENPRWQAIDQSLSKINSICENHNIGFILLYNRNPGDHVRDMLDNVGAREGFPVATLDLAASPAWQADPEQYRNSQVDVHPNAAGGRIYAERIYAALVEHDMLN